jgi:hypothetical protein
MLPQIQATMIGKGRITKNKFDIPKSDYEKKNGWFLKLKKCFFFCFYLIRIEKKPSVGIIFGLF